MELVFLDCFQEMAILKMPINLLTFDSLLNYKQTRMLLITWKYSCYPFNLQNFPS